MKTTIVITLLNDWRVIDTLESLLKQSLKPNEIIVADGGSDQILLKEIKKYSKKYNIIKFYDIPGNIAESRNKTMKLIDTDIIIFIDSDEKAPKNWLIKIINPIIKNKADFVGGKTIPMRKPKNKVEKYVYKKSEYNYQNIYKYDVSKIHMGNSAWRKKIFDKIGNFDEKIKWGGEDYDINIRAINAGFKGVFLEDAWVWHDRGVDTLRKFIKKKYKYDIGSTITYLKNNESKIKAKKAIKISFIHPLEFFSLIIKPFSYLKGQMLYRKLYSNKDKKLLIKKGEGI